MLPDGTVYRIDTYKPRGKAPYQRYIATCLHHTHCERKKSTSLWTVAAQEPLAYLMAWNKMGADLTKEQHSERKRHPPQAEVLKQLVVLENGSKSASSSGSKS